MSNLRVPEPHEYEGFLPDDFAGNILGVCDIARSGWEADFAAPLVLRDGRKTLVRLGETSVVGGRTEDVLADRITKYVRLIRETEALLEEYLR